MTSTGVPSKQRTKGGLLENCQFQSCQFKQRGRQSLHLEVISLSQYWLSVFLGNHWDHAINPEKKASSSVQGTKNGAIFLSEIVCLLFLQCTKVELSSFLSHTAGSDIIFVQIYMDPPPGVPGVSKNKNFFSTNKTVEFFR